MFKIKHSCLLCGFPQKPHRIHNLLLKLNFQSWMLNVQCTIWSKCRKKWWNSFPDHQFMLLKVKYLTYLSSLKTKLSCKRTMNWNKIKIKLFCKRTINGNQIKMKLFCKRIINGNQNHLYPHPAPHHDLVLTQLWLVYNVFPLFQLRAACRLCSCERKYRSSPSFRESPGFFHTKTRLLSQSNQGPFFDTGFKKDLPWFCDHLKTNTRSTDKDLSYSSLFAFLILPFLFDHLSLTRSRQDKDGDWEWLQGHI